MSNTPQVLTDNIIASLVLKGDLSGMNPQERVQYYNYRCHQAGIDPAAKPFDLLKLNGKEVLYANATCAQQLCATRGLSVSIVNKEAIDGIYMVWARVTDLEGRSTENLGAVSLDGLKGEALCNALMKATTKATRRTVLAHCGLGLLDESETDSIPGAQKVELLDGTPPIGITGTTPDISLPEAMKPERTPEQKDVADAANVLMHMTDLEKLELWAKEQPEHVRKDKGFRLAYKKRIEEINKSQSSAVPV